ncbi:hypothetical protein [Mesorhizobium sp. WSM3860]|nr:hypothetical protein [Mesorhizobium sp. WSM3860]
MHETQAGLIFDARDVVGESLVWDERRERLVWVDISAAGFIGWIR